MTSDESRIKAERPPRLDLTGIEAVIFDKDGTLIDFHAMWGGWARELGDRLDAVIRRPVSLDVFATIGFDPTDRTGRARRAARDGDDGGHRGDRRAGAAPLVPEHRRRSTCDGGGLARPGPGRARRPARRPRRRSSAGCAPTDGASPSITNDDRAPTDATLRALGVRESVEAMVCGDDGFAVKPAPDAVIAVCHAFRTEPSRVAVIGDTPADVAMAPCGGRRPRGRGAQRHRHGRRPRDGRRRDRLGRRTPRLIDLGHSAPRPGTDGLSPRNTPDRTFARYVRLSNAGPAPERRRAPDSRASVRAAAPVARGPHARRGAGRIAAKVSGRRDLTGLFDDIIDEAFALFGVDRAGLWTVRRDCRPPADPRGAARAAADHHRCRVVADRRTPGRRGWTPSGRAGSASSDRRDARDDPIASRGLPVDRRRVDLLRAARLRRRGARPARAVPPGDIRVDAVRSAPLPARSATTWRRRSARLGWPTPAAALADRLSSIAELAGRLSGLHDQASIASAIVEEAKRLIEHDTIRVYRVDHADRDVRAHRVRGHVPRHDRARPGDARACPSGQGLTGLGRRARSSRCASTTRINDPRVVVLGDAPPRVDAPRPDGPGGDRAWRDRRLRARRRAASTTTTR